MAIEKKRDDEKLITLIVSGIFSGALLAILLTAGNLFHMGVLLSVIAVIAVGSCVYSWHMLIKYMTDPNKDYWRWLCMLFAIAAIVIIMGHRAGWLSDKQVQIDSHPIGSIGIREIDSLRSLPNMLVTSDDYNIIAIDTTMEGWQRLYDSIWKSQHSSL